MDIYAQQGSRKAQKISQGLDDGCIKGVILSPYDEKPVNLKDLVTELRAGYEAAEVMLDPQFYVFGWSAPKLGHLAEYIYAPADNRLNRFDSIETVKSQVDAVLQYQLGLNVTRILAPTTYFSAGDDLWAVRAIQMAQESAEYMKNRDSGQPLHISLAFDIGALRSRELLEDLLNELTKLDVDGFYLIPGHRDYQTRDEYDEDELAHLMHLVNVLSEHQGYNVICGYSDLVGTLLHAVGASATGAGWSKSSRRFATSRWSTENQRVGGKPGYTPPRFTSGKLLTSLSMEVDIRNVANAGRLDDVTSEPALVDELLNGRARGSWTEATASLVHWRELAKLAERVSSQGSTMSNLSMAEEIIRDAIERYDRLRSDPAISLEVSAWRPNLKIWLGAIEIFRREWVTS